MQAKVIKDFDGAPDGALYPKHFAPGATVEGDLAAVAIREGWAEESKPDPSIVVIPPLWETFLAADAVALARSLGAGDDVKTKALAAEFIAAEVGRREAAAQPAT